MPKLLISNPEQLEYENGVLHLSILGGIRLDGLDRMRVTLKVALADSPRPPVRHNLDLYNDTQLEKFIRKVAERLEIGTSVIAASLAELTEELERYRLSEIQSREEKQIIRKPLSPQEKEESLNFLSSAKLMERTGALIGESGVIGEESNRLLMYVIFTSRKREEPLHIVSLGSSGIGKTHLQEKVGELIPEEDRIEITTLSENAFYYFGQRELKNKLILIEDLDGAEGVLYPLRELQSKKKICKTIAHKNTRGDTRTVHLVVEGPVSVSGCTTREQIYEDNANRSFLIYLDESKEQDKKIMEYQRKRSAGKLDKEREYQIQKLLKNCQRFLQPVTVINPYAEKLQIPEEVLKPRRTNNHYLQFVEAVTYYHQYQREHKTDKETGEIYIETTYEDIKEANKLMKEVILRKSDDLNGACRNYFERLKEYLVEAQQTEFMNREISIKLRIPISTVKRYHLELFNSGRIKLAERKKTKGYKYEIINKKEYDQLRESIETVLDKVLKQVQPSSPQVAQPKNGLPKIKRTKPLEA